MKRLSTILKEELEIDAGALGAAEGEKKEDKKASNQGPIYLDNAFVLILDVLNDRKSYIESLFSDSKELSLTSTRVSDHVDVSYLEVRWTLDEFSYVLNMLIPTKSVMTDPKKPLQVTRCYCDLKCYLEDKLLNKAVLDNQKLDQIDWAFFEKWSDELKKKEDSEETWTISRR